MRPATTGVPSVPEADAPYHHGDLPAALLRAVDEIVAEEGVGGVSLRGVARRAGVSHAAPAHHFGDRGGLLAAYAADGFDALTARMDAARRALPDGATVTDAMAAMGRAYVAFGVEERGYYEVMWRKELLDCEMPRLVTSGGCSYAALLATVRAGLTRDATDDDVTAVAMTAWATVHGFVSLVIGMPTAEIEHLPDPGPLLEPVMHLLLNGLRSHPRWQGDDVLAAAIPDDLADPLVPVSFAG